MSSTTPIEWTDLTWNPLLEDPDMRTHRKLNPCQITEVENYSKHGFPLVLKKIQIRMAPGGFLLHKDTVTENLDIGMFIGEAFRKLILITLLTKKRVRSGCDYQEARWNQCGHEFYSNGYVLSPTRLEYMISLLGPCLRWTEEWTWQGWPEPSDIKHRLDVLIMNYEATQRLLAYLQGEKVDHSFDEQSKHIHIENVSVWAYEGKLRATCSFQSSVQVRNAAQILKHLAKFLDFKPDSLSTTNNPKPMEVGIELA